MDILVTPRPQVWTLDLEGGSVELGARCWTDNENYWLTQCEMKEMIKLRFDHQNIRIALPMQQVYLRPQLGDNGELGSPMDSMTLKEAANENQ